MSAIKQSHQDAIRKATELFWSKGFHATSMRNIQQAMDMRPGSIYASFGGKEALFKKALHAYTANSQASLQASVAAAGSPLAGLKQFVIDAVIGGAESSPSGLCMLVKTISELTDEHADLLAEARRLLSVLEDDFAAILQRAKEAGELSESSDCTRLARYLQMQLMGLRAYARTNAGGDDQLRALIDDTFAIIGKS